MRRNQVLSGRPMSRLLLPAMLAAIVGLLASDGYAQQNVWSVNYRRPSELTAGKAVKRQSFPSEFKMFDLNIDPLRQELFSVTGDAARKRSTVITVPNANGDVEYFEVFEASNFEPGLQAAFPDIRAYSGRGISDRNAL